MSTRRIGSSSIGGGGGGSNVRYQTDETPGTVVGELWVDSDGTSNLVNSNDYLTKVDASAEYLSSISASNTYLSQDSASATYATQTSLTSGLASKLDFSGKRIVQVIRNTSGSNLSTTSTSYVDVPSMNVTITPESNTSAVILIATTLVESPAGGNIKLAITDSSNNIVSGTGDGRVFASGAGAYNQQYLTIIGYSTPATTSATTYKVRASVSSGTGFVYNSLTTGQLYAIEVSA